MFALSQEGGVWKVSTDIYQLTFPTDRPFVYLAGSEGQRLADLFIFSGVHPLHGRDDTTGLSGPSGAQTWEASETSDEVVLSLSVDSSIWRSKTYRFRCSPRRFQYEVEVEGDGQLCEVNYFGGYSSSQVRWGSGFFWSGQRFQKVFTPEPNKPEVNTFAPAENALIDLMGVPLPGKDNWFFTPPPFCYAVEVENTWMSLGVEARPGEYRFTEYGYHGRNKGFYLSLSYEGHTQVRGSYRLPSIGFDFGGDEYSVLSAHVQALQSVGIPRQLPRKKPSWWYEPIFCGWGAQNYLSSLNGGLAPKYSRQADYESFLKILESHGLNPGIVVLDDKWQATYGDNQVDEEKWPDLRGFIQRQHAQGRRVLLWLKAWDPQGLPAEECITNARGLPLAFDPSNPQFEERLIRSVQRMLSPQGYNADGFKIDFTARIPSGPGLCIYGDLWGLELMKRYLAILYRQAKQSKPEALVIAHTPHAYLADVVDMIRLNDINPDRDVCQAMELRARVASIACPDAIIDTDNWPVEDRATWRRYLRVQPDLGVPSLYFASHIDKTGEPLEPGDYQLIREAWEKYRSRVGAITGKSVRNA